MLTVESEMGFTPITPEQSKEHFVLERPPVRCFRLNDLPQELKDNIYDHALVEETTFNLIDKDDKAKPAQVSSSTERATDEVMADANALPVDEGVMMGGTHQAAPRATMRFRADTNILLANKLISQEYKKRARASMQLILKDHHEYSFQPVRLSHHAKDVRSLDLYLILFCHTCPLHPHLSSHDCNAKVEVQNHRQWIDNLLAQMQQLRHLRIFAHICHGGFKLGDKTKLPCEEILKATIRRNRAERSRSASKDVQSRDGWLELKGLRRFVLYRAHFDTNKNEMDGPKEVLFDWQNGEEKIVKKPKEEKKAETSSEDVVGEAEVQEKPAASVPTSAGHPITPFQALQSMVSMSMQA